MDFSPSYLKLYERGELEERAENLKQILKCCKLCPRNCKVNRIKGEKGYCRAPGELVVSSAFAHFGEEPPLVGIGGSGTIFFTHCNLKCIFCQNYEISHLGEGKIVSAKELAKIMVSLQERGCHNINLVTPTHYVPQIIESLPFAIEKGLKLPIVYNCGGYENVEVIRLLDGIIDIYMPDIKFFDSKVAKLLCNAPDYPDVVKSSVKEMYRQVGDLKINRDGIAIRGLLIRHLVMPNGLAGTKEVTEFIISELSKDSYVNIMDQYRPCYKAFEIPQINRRITYEEYLNAIKIARESGLYRGF